MRGTDIPQNVGENTMSLSFTDDLMVSIVEHDNEGVRRFLSSNVDILRSLKDSTYTTPPALSVSAEAGNLQAMCILLEFGWVDSVSTALKEAIRDKDFSKAHLLMSFGFASACDDCYQCGWPNTCALVNSMLTHDVLSERSGSTLGFWCRSHDEKDVMSAFSRFITGGGFSEDRASRILDVMIKSGNDVVPGSLPSTEKNAEFILFLVGEGRVDVTKQAHRVVMDMMSQVYSFKSDVKVRLDTLYSLLKSLIDIGADVDTSFDVEETYLLPVILPDMDYSEGLSVREIAGGFRASDMDVKRVKWMHSRHSHVQTVGEYMKMSMGYIKFSSRKGFLSKRVRGFGSDEDPGCLYKQLVNMPVDIFVKIIGFLF